MGKTTVAVTKHLLEQVLQLPADIRIVDAKTCPFDHSIDLVLEGSGVPDADRCKTVATRVQYKFEPIQETK